MACNDVREWVDKLKKEGELATIKTEVDWDLELGGIARENMDRGGRALLFENIKDYKNTICKKLFTCSLSTQSRIAIMLGLPKTTSYKELIQHWRKQAQKRIKPVNVDYGPCKENILKGDDVDLFQLPAPHWQKLDGGRYIGTFHGVITKDPDTNWENVGMYRQVIHDKNTTSMSVAQGQHIWMHWRKYRRKGQNMPCAIVIGVDPTLTAVASSPVPNGVDEWDVMGALRGEPVKLVKCETVDLRVPATAEIVLEGELVTDLKTFKNDGPFGEFTGYYGLPSMRPIFKVNCVTFRNDPIFQGTMEGLPIVEDQLICGVNHSAEIWNLLEERMLGVTGVNCEPSASYGITIVQIDNSYYGQVHQVANNIWGSKFTLDSGKNIIVCDTDVDIWDLRRVFWALAFRVDPKTDIIQHPGMIHALDPIIHIRDKVGAGGNAGTRLLIDATKSILKPRAPEYGNERFPQVAYPDEETMKKVRENWYKYGIEA